jgi:hypothetical protein
MSQTLTRSKHPKHAKVDLYKEFASEYVTPKVPRLIDVGEAVYLTIDGVGEPGGDAFGAAVGALYAVAFTLKMARKFAGQDYTVAKLEGLWWTEPASAHFMETPREQWHWKLMIRIPEFVTADEVAGATESLIMKGKPALVRQVQREVIDEGRCVQMLHLGPYADEPKSLKMMQDLVTAAGLRFTGRHHEIYLSDPHRAAPEKLRTILRHPVAK